MEVPLLEVPGISLELLGTDSRTIYWVVPLAQDASHHQDHYIFSRGSQLSFATNIVGGGDNPNYTF